MDTGRVETSRLSGRIKILLEIIDRFSNAFAHPTSSLLHEYILLCRLKGGKKLPGLQSYDFHAYMRGPYSEELRNDLEKLYRMNLIGVRGGRLVVTEPGKELSQKNRKGTDYKTATETCQEVLKDFSTAHAISEGLFDSLRDVSLGEIIRY